MSDQTAEPMRPAGYHQIIQRSESDRRRRSQFQRIASELVAPGSCLLEFGAGTGIDAKAYAARNYRVYAYDASREMREFFADHCAKEIEAGMISLIDLDYNSLLDREHLCERRFDLVTANFAVFNLIPDHAPLFKALSGWVAADGAVLASMLSPYYFRDARYRWWWRGLRELARVGHYKVGSDEGTSYRFCLKALKRAAEPYFSLDRVISESSVPSLWTTHFMFLVFRKR